MLTIATIYHFCNILLQKREIETIKYNQMHYGLPEKRVYPAPNKAFVSIRQINAHKINDGGNAGSSEFTGEKRF